VRRDIPGSYGDNAEMRVAVPSPPRDIDVRACISNRGTRRVALHAAADRTIAPWKTTVNGRRNIANPTFAFWESRPVSIFDRLPRIVGRVALFKPGIVGPWLIWPLLLVIVLVVPLAAIWAFARAVDDEDGDDLRRDPPPESDESSLSAPAA
jgi:hypothetical protein